MPLSEPQRAILALLAENRSPESYVAGASPIVVSAARFSGDLDIFQDRMDLVEEAALADARAIERVGMTITWKHRLPTFWSGTVDREGEPVHLEWAHDSAFRFYPAQRDPFFGYVLHPVDLATNKLLAAAARREARDLVDLLTLNPIVPIVAAVIAAPAKDPGFTPEALVQNVWRFSNHRQAAFDALDSTVPIDGPTVIRAVREELRAATELAARLPSDAVGRIYLENDAVVVPDPDRLDRYTILEGSVGGVVVTVADVSVGLIIDTSRAAPPSPRH